ncbi:GNAT family N-acetyltransferase [Rudaea sp.]|uniref:GNAT family N-acetyltransferase n=1 Tax=Rudaea sp. TaxID=2136325 RepID=UPI00321FF676
MSLEIREIGADQFDLVWPIFHAVVAAGDTYSYAPDTGFEEARALWTSAPTRCFVALIDGRPAGCYMLKPNQPGLGSHVANAGYMVAAHARGQGLAGKLCEHSLATARAAGFLAMQFNFVVGTNEVAVNLWQKHGFRIVGTVPKAFRHAQRGLVDIHVMHRIL